MTEAEAIEAVCQAWEDGWEALHPADPLDPNHVPYTFKNESYDAPTGWVRVTVRSSVRVQATMGPAGGRRYDNRGTIFVQIFADVNQGDAPLASLADDARAVLESLRIGSPADVCIHAGSSRDGTPRDVQLETDGRWAMRLVSFPMMWFEQR